MPVKPASFLVMGVMLLYPVAVYVGLNSFEPRVFGLLLVGMLLLRQRSLVRRFAASLSVGDWWVFMGLAAFALFVAIGNSERLLLLYPAVVSLALLLLFARSLFYPPTMIERIARLSEPDLPPAARLAAAASITDRISAGKAPAEAVLKTWGTENRYAGSKDRRAIADRVYKVLRARGRLSWAMGGRLKWLSTSLTPGSARAAESSMAVMRPRAITLQITLPCSRPSAGCSAA